MRPDIYWQSFHICSPKVSYLSYMTPKGLQNIGFQTIVMLGCQVDSAQFRLTKAVSHLDVLIVNLILSDQATTLSTSGCPYCGHCELSTDHQHRHSQRYPS